jgi:hypothetical protein
MLAAAPPWGAGALRAHAAAASNATAIAIAIARDERIIRLFYNAGTGRAARLARSTG